MHATLEASVLPAVILLIAASRGNRAALREAGRQLRDAYPLGSRAVLGMLRNGEVPRQNGIVLLQWLGGGAVPIRRAQLPAKQRLPRDHAAPIAIGPARLGVGANE